MVAEWRQRVHVPQGFPHSNTDTAPTAVFLALFFLSALSHMFIFLRNKRRGHFFIFNGLVIGFCMARVVTTSLRLAWIYNIENRGLGIAATIFVAAGVLILFLINLIFAQRILRSLHPHLGWHKALSRVFLILYGLIPLLLVMVVTATTQSFFTTDSNIVRMDIDMQRGGSSYFLFIAFLPIPMTVFALGFPKRLEPDNFGKGTFLQKSAVVLTASIILCLGAAFRTGTSFVDWKESYTTSPPWYSAKWCFYFFNFTLEIIVVWLFLALRVDLLFHVPDGSKGAGSYSRGKEAPSQEEDIETRGLRHASTDHMSNHTLTCQAPVEQPENEKEQL